MLEGPNEEHLTRLQLRGHSWQQESRHFCVSARVASSQLPVCYLYALGCFLEELGLQSAHRETVAAGVSRKSPQRSLLGKCKCFPEASVSYWNMKNVIPFVFNTWEETLANAA